MGSCDRDTCVYDFKAQSGPLEKKNVLIITPRVYACGLVCFHFIGISLVGDRFSAR